MTDGDAARSVPISRPQASRGIRAGARIVSAIAASALGVALLLAITFVALGIRPSIGFTAVWVGAFGSAADGHLYAISETLVKTAPLLFAALSIVVAWRAGLFSIGAEGQILIGAIMATVIGRWATAAPGPLVTGVALISSAAAGAGWSLIAGWLRVRRNVQEVVSTIMLNYVALYLLGWLVQGPLQERGGHLPQSDPLPDGVLFARLIPAAWAGGVTPRLHTGVLLAFLAAPLVFWLLYRTVAGFEMRVTGQNADVARSCLYPVDRLRMLAMAVSGALCGAAGAVELLGVTGRLYADFSPGWGYTAIPVALLGGLHPLGAALSALLFGALTAGTDNLARRTGVSLALIDIIQATAVLAAVAIRAWRARRLPMAEE